MDNKVNMPWYKKTIGIICLIILFFPIGLFLMWKYTNWNKTIKWIITTVFALFVLAGATGNNKTASLKEQKQITNTTIPVLSVTTKPTLKEESAKTYLVTRVIDGDTIEIEGNKKVRYIGIDTPETVDPRKPVQCFGKEASNKNKELVEGKRVKLEKDVSETDKYGRLLRYVYIDKTFINDYLVREGFASAVSYPPDIKYQDQFLEAERQARELKKGLWADDACPIATPTQGTNASPINQGASTGTTTIPTVSSGGGGGFTCAGKTRCDQMISCTEARFYLTNCGVSRLDGNNNGIPCENLCK